MIFAITADIGNVDGELVVPKWKIRLNENLVPRRTGGLKKI